MKANKKVLTCKIETTYGTDANPAVGTDDVLVSGFSVVPLDAQYVERNVVQLNFGSQVKVSVGESMKMEFDIEIAGSGAVDTAPAYASVLRMCAWAETITPTTGPVTYSLISDSEESASVYFYWDGVLHKMLGARGSAEFKISEGGIPVIHIAAVGLYGGITVAALGGTPDLSAFQIPLGCNEANTAFSLHGYAAALASLTINQGAKMVYKNRPGLEKVRYVDCKVTGQVSIECPKPDVKDFFEICLAGTTGALAMTHGTVVGNKGILAAGAVQLTNPRTSEGDNIVMLAMDMTFLSPDAGNGGLTYATQ